MISLEAGMASAKEMFQLAGPLGLVTVRMALAGIMLMLVWRRSLRIDKYTFVIAACYGVIVAMMNISLYLAIERIPLGSAISIEFLGPLAVAIIGSRRILDLLWALLAGVGVFLLTGVGAGIAISGVLCALVAAVCWGSYIVVGVKLGARTKGGFELGIGMIVGSLVAAPFGFAESGKLLLSPGLLLAGFCVALLSSAIPYSLELEVMRKIPRRSFGILMSLEPVVATLAGLVILGELLTTLQWLAVWLIVAASIGSARYSRGE